MLEPVYLDFFLGSKKVLSSNILLETKSVDVKIIDLSFMLPRLIDINGFDCTAAEILALKLLRFVYNEMSDDIVGSSDLFHEFVSYNEFCYIV